MLRVIGNIDYVNNIIQKLSYKLISDKNIRTMQVVLWRDSVCPSANFVTFLSSAHITVATIRNTIKGINVTYFVSKIKHIDLCYP